MNFEVSRLFKRNDIVLIITIVLIAGGFFVFNIISQEDGGTVIVKVDGNIHKEFQLSEETVYTIDFEDGRYNTLIIKDGYAKVVEASCPDQICVNHQKIQKTGETIICLPNRVVIEIESTDTSELDAIAN